jgi:hypothetical protein
MPDAVAFAPQLASASNVVTAYAGVAAVVGPAAINTSGLNGTIMFEIVENNVAGGLSVVVEGSFQSAAATAALWYGVGFYPIVTAGTVQTTLTRTTGTQAISQNSRYVWQVLDAYPNMRVRVTANGSSASLTVNLYAIAA